MSVSNLAAEQLLALAISGNTVEFKNKFLKLFCRLTSKEIDSIVQKISSLCQKNLASLYGVAISFSQSSFYDQALIFFNEISILDPKKPEILYQKSLCHFKNFQVPEAIENIRQAINYSDLPPSTYYLDLGNFYHSIGELNLALDNFHEYIKLSDKPAIGHHAVSSIVKYKTIENQHLKEMSDFFLNVDEENDEKMFISYALSKAYDDIGDNARSFYYLNIANDIKRKKINFSIPIVKSQFNMIKEIFNDAGIINIINKSNKNNNYKPIFIVGMPRSGTTLVEQIISSHSQVKSTGESMILPTIIKQFFPESDVRKFKNSVLTINDQTIENFHNDYLHMAFLKGGKKVLTDKLPFNFIFIGFIKLFLPEAKIIHCQRNKYAICTSILKNYFDNNLLGFAYDQNELGQYYNLYNDLMSFWKFKFSSSLYNIEYENLVNNFDFESKNLIKFCELEWEDNCKDFYKNSNPVVTVSSTQIRQNVYTSSVDSWEQYLPFINKLIKIIN